MTCFQCCLLLEIIWNVVFFFIRYHPQSTVASSQLPHRDHPFRRGPFASHFELGPSAWNEEWIFSNQSSREFVIIIKATKAKRDQHTLEVVL